MKYVYNFGGQVYYTNAYHMTSVASRSAIMPCNSINKPLVVYRFSRNVMTSITTLTKHNDKILTFFYNRNEISKYMSYDK